MRCRAPRCCCYERAGVSEGLCKSRNLVWCARRYADHRGAQHSALEHVSRREFVYHYPLCMIGRFHFLDRVVQVRVELFTDGIDALHALLRKNVPNLPADQLEAFAIFRVGRIVIAGERAIKAVEYSEQRLDDSLDAAMTGLAGFFFDTLFVV